LSDNVNRFCRNCEFVQVLRELPVMRNEPPWQHERLTSRLYLRLAPSMLAELHRAADREERAVSDLVRRWLGRMLVSQMPRPRDVT
jgi:hypothetical protein